MFLEKVAQHYERFRIEPDYRQAVRFAPHEKGAAESFAFILDMAVYDVEKQTGRKIEVDFETQVIEQNNGWLVVVLGRSIPHEIQEVFEQELSDPSLERVH